MPPDTRWIRTAFVVLSLAVHVAAFLSVERASRQPPPTKKRPIKMQVTKAPEVPPPPPPVEKPPEPVKVTKKTQVVEKKIDTTPPPPSAPPKSAEPPPPPVFGLSLSSTGNGSFVAPVGNTTMTDSKNTKPAAEVKPLSGTGTGRAPVSLAQVNKLPEPQGACPPGNPRQLYTEEAVAQEIEGKVVIEATIDESGRVTKANVLRGLGYGLDEAAVRALKEQCRFSPAEVNGEKVVTTIRYSFSFVLEE